MLWAYSHSAHSPSVSYSHIVLSNCKEDRKMRVIRYNVCLELCLWHRLFFWSIVLPFSPHIVHSYPFPKGGQSSSKFKPISSSWSKSGIWAGTESPLPLVWSYFLIRLWLCPQESSFSSILLHGPQLHFLDVFLFSVIFLYYIWREC